MRALDVFGFRLITVLRTAQKRSDVNAESVRVTSSSIWIPDAIHAAAQAMHRSDVSSKNSPRNPPTALTCLTNLLSVAQPRQIHVT